MIYFLKINKFFLASNYEILEHNVLQSKVYYFLHNILNAPTEKDFIHFSKKFSLFKYYHSIDKKEINTNELNNIISLGKAIIFNPLEYSNLINNDLNHITEHSIKMFKNTSYNQINELNNLIANNSYNCAIVSIFSILKNDLSEDEKLNQFNIQDVRFKIFIQNNLFNDYDIYYWYALHWYLKNNLKNCEFYLKQYQKHSLKIHFFHQDNYLSWLKKYIPVNFELMAQSFIH